MWPGGPKRNVTNAVEMLAVGVATANSNNVTVHIVSKIIANDMKITKLFLNKNINHNPCPLCIYINSISIRHIPYFRFKNMIELNVWLDFVVISLFFFKSFFFHFYLNFFEINALKILCQIFLIS